MEVWTLIKAIFLMVLFVKVSLLFMSIWLTANIVIRVRSGEKVTESETAWPALAFAVFAAMQWLY